MENEEADREMNKAKGIGPEAIGVQESPLAIGFVPRAWRFL